jgi:hypothetical protein
MKILSKIGNNTMSAWVPQDVSCAPSWELSTLGTIFNAGRRKK